MAARRFVALFVTAGLVVAGLAPAPAASETGEGVFVPAVGPDERSTGRHALRERFVTIDLSRLSPEARASGTVVFNLFDDAVVQATASEIEVRGADDITWIGEVGGLGYVVITVQGGVAAGRIVDETGRAFTVSFVGDGVHVVTEPDPASYPPRAEPLGVRGAPGSGAAARAVTVETYIDLLVVYTKRAKNLRGGKDSIEALITSAVAEGNRAFEKSGIGVALRLVDVRQVDYSESGNSERDLERVTETGDGRMDEVHGWRDSSGADMVSLIVGNDDWCGIAWTMQDLAPGFDRYAFSVVAADCIDFEATLPHELGHNLGANHERQQVALTDPGLSAVFPYAFAWYLDGEFRTIMSYGNFCTPESGGAPNWTGCPFVLRFSSSRRGLGGLPTGDADNDNARAIRNTAPTVAEFRDEVGGGGTRTCAGLAATHTPADAVDGVIVGTRNDDVILGGAGADVIKGKGGDDTICSLGGKDKVYGNAGNDTIYGGGGRDVIRGGGGRDALFGQAGNDKLVGNRGSDTGNGGGGTDTCISIETATSCER